MLSTLQKSWQFRVCYNRGRKAVGQYAVVFYYTPGDDDDTPQIGIVASKRVGNAVVRNRAKRLLRVAARSIADRLNDQNMWVVLIAKSAISTRTSKEVQNDLERVLQSVNLLR